MATVYLAHDVRHERPVALKVLHPEVASVLGPERLLREIKLAARLQHPHILTVLDSGEVASRETQYVPPFGLAMAYARLGDKSRAIAWLERVIAERDVLMPENFFDPLFEPLVGDPRFAEVERRTGLTPRR